MNWVIYALKDPRTDVIRYVGFTTHRPEVRLRQHVSKAVSGNERTAKSDWLLSLADAGLRPSVEIIESGFGEGWEITERRWIAFYRAQGLPLVNTAIGGEGILNWGTPEQRHIRSKNIWVNKPPEQRRAIALKREAAKTPEQRQTASLKRLASWTPEQRRAGSLKAAAAMTPEQRRARTAKVAAAMTPDKYRARSLKSAAAKTPEQRSESARKREAAMTFEQRSERAFKREAAKRAARASA